MQRGDENHDLLPAQVKVALLPRSAVGPEQSPRTAGKASLGSPRTMRLGWLGRAASVFCDMRPNRSGPVLGSIHGKPALSKAFHSYRGLCTASAQIILIFALVSLCWWPWRVQSNRGK